MIYVGIYKHKSVCEFNLIFITTAKISVIYVHLPGREMPNPYVHN